MADNNKTRTAITTTPDVSTDVSEPRIHIDEFIGKHPELTKVQKTAFKMITGTKTWMRLSEWEQEIKKYLNK